MEVPVPLVWFTPGLRTWSGGRAGEYRRGPGGLRVKGPIKDFMETFRCVRISHSLSKSFDLALGVTRSKSSLNILSLLILCIMTTKNYPDMFLSSKEKVNENGGKTS